MRLNMAFLHRRKWLRLNQTIFLRHKVVTSDLDLFCSLRQFPTSFGLTSKSNYFLTSHATARLINAIPIRFVTNLHVVKTIDSHQKRRTSRL